ncbi:hypothetical protein ABH920_003647 [Catenulispora sp. EB89]
MEISDRGRIPSDLIARYERAHGLDRIPDDQGRALPLLPHFLHGALLIRTDFSDDDAWLAVIAAVRAPTVEGFTAHIDICEDRAFADLPPDRLTAHLPNRHRHSVLFVVDAVTIRNPEHPLVAIGLDVTQPPVATLRIIPSAVQMIENNLTSTKMWFQDFVVQADPDGVLRLY